MKREIHFLEILFLKIVVIVIGIPYLALCIFGLPSILREGSGYLPAWVVYTAITCMYAAAIPFFTALYQAIRLLGYVGKNKAFSELSLKALKNIKYCGILVSFLYLFVMPFIYFVAEQEDAPGMIIIGMVITAAPTVIAVFADVIQKLFIKAMDTKMVQA